MLKSSCAFFMSSWIVEHKHSKLKGEVFPKLLLLVIKSMLYAQITFKQMRYFS
jgi:hypothetical protein